MKKLLILAVIICTLALAFTSCGGNNSGNGGENPGENAGNENNGGNENGGNTEVVYSQGLQFTSNGDGTCYVSGIGSCTDTDVVIPLTSLDWDIVTSIGDHAFEWCTSLTSVTFAKGSQLTSIGDGAFLECPSLTSIEIPASVTSIGDDAFEWCTSLTSVTFAEGSQLTSIGDGAFSWCESLTSIEIPASVTFIGDYAFSCGSSLTYVYYGGSEEEWAAIEIGDFNEYLTNVTIHYNS